MHRFPPLCCWTLTLGPLRPQEPRRAPFRAFWTSTRSSRRPSPQVALTRGSHPGRRLRRGVDHLEHVHRAVGAGPRRAGTAERGNQVLVASRKGQVHTFTHLEQQLVRRLCLASALLNLAHRSKRSGSIGGAKSQFHHQPFPSARRRNGSTGGTRGATAGRRPALSSTERKLQRPASSAGQAAFSIASSLPTTVYASLRTAGIGPAVCRTTSATVARAPALYIAPLTFLSRLSASCLTRWGTVWLVAFAGIPRKGRR